MKDIYVGIALLVGFCAMIWLFAYLKKSGKISKEQANTIATIANGLSYVTDALSDANNGKGAYGVADMVMTFVSKAVLAAENAWYNDEIEKAERSEFCMKRFHELMDAYDVFLTEEQEATVRTLIAAECEEIGHQMVKAGKIEE